MRTRLALIALAAALVCASQPSTAANHLAVRYYVSLGDSLAVGVQPNGILDEGYADQLHRALVESYPKLRLVKLGCSGESSASMRFGSLPPEAGASCGPPGLYRKRYAHRTQLAEAVSFLRAHRGFVRLVTIDIGANDLLSSLGRASIARNLPVILAELRRAAGPDVAILGMNYHDPFLAVVWRKTHDLPALRAEIRSAAEVNDFLETLYRRSSTTVADVEAAFRVTDTTLVRGTPRNVVLECRWTWICAEPPSGPDIHLTTEGYGVVAQAFLDRLPRRLISSAS